MHFLIHGLNEYASGFTSSIVQTNMPSAYFSLLYPYFKESLIDVHPYVQGFYSSWAFGLLVDEIIRNSYIIYIRNPNCIYVTLTSSTSMAHA